MFVSINSQEGSFAIDFAFLSIIKQLSMTQHKKEQFVSLTVIYNPISFISCFDIFIYTLIYNDLYRIAVLEKILHTLLWSPWMFCLRIPVHLIYIDLYRISVLEKILHTLLWSPWMFCLLILVHLIDNDFYRISVLEKTLHKLLWSPSMFCLRRIAVTSSPSHFVPCHFIPWFGCLVSLYQTDRIDYD